MSLAVTVESALGQVANAVVVERGVQVKTHCLYPSNSAVNVTVSRRGEQFVVDDDGASLDEIAQSVHTEQDLLRLMKGVVARRGCLLTRRGEIMSPPIQQSEIKAAIVLVANASKAVAEHLLANARPPRRSFRKAIEEVLNQKFKDRWSRNQKIVGASMKAHGFDYVVRIGGDKQLALDFVSPDASSVNSAVVAHLDVRMKNWPDLEQRIVYDDTQPWRSSDIELLKAGARPVPLSSLRQSLERFVA